jgi:ATP-dependent DNA helicase PIF1
LRQIISWAKADQWDDDEPTVGVTASTGMAAVNIGGVTLHSWAGIGLGNEPAEHYVKAIKYGPKKLHKRWRRAKTLIIDEGSVWFSCSHTVVDKMSSIYD